LAHAEIFTLLAGMTDDAAVAPVLLGAAGVVRRLMIVAGPAANGMIVSSRQRLLAYLRAGDTDGATLEMERHLRGLHFMSRLVGDDPGAVLIVRPRRPAEQAAASPSALDSSSPGSSPSQRYWATERWGGPDAGSRLAGRRATGRPDVSLDSPNEGRAD
jgi:hypothetical protein